MKQRLDEFQRQEDGAVTVDWVVVTAAVVGLGLAILYPIAIGTGNMASGVGGKLAEEKIEPFTAD